jgi:hypothetical protein
MKPLNQNKMDFGLGLFTGMFIMWAVAKRIQIEIKKDLEKLKEFDTSFANDENLGEYWISNHEDNRDYGIYKKEKL